MKILFKKYLFICLIFISTFFSCTLESPFKELSVILSNDYIDHVVSINVLDVNPLAADPYPDNVILTLSGSSVTNGLIYSGDGNVLTESVGDAKLIGNVVNLAIKPYTLISADSPIKFRIKATAPNYSLNSKEITVSSLDSLKFIDLKLLNLNDLPEGVVFKETVSTDITEGSPNNDIVIEVEEAISNEVEAVVTISAGTVFFDEDNNALTSGDTLLVNVEGFDASDNAVSSISGGLADVQTDNGTLVSFILGAAVNIVASIGNTNITTFSTPFEATLNLGTDVFNPITGNKLQEGDIMEVWSKDADSDVWNSEGSTLVTRDSSSGDLKTTLSVDHLSTWMAAYSRESCSDPLVLTYYTESPVQELILIRVFKGTGSNAQVYSSEVYDLSDGDTVSLTLPDVTCTIRTYDGPQISDTLIDTAVVQACAVATSVTNNVENNNPILVFDLVTSCDNGEYRYSGPIKYKKSGTNIWLDFNSSNSGTLTTQLLAWESTYDFKIVYNQQLWENSQKVEQSEFRIQSGGSYTFWGSDPNNKRTSFIAPTQCN